MSSTDLLKVAELVATIAHHGQFDKQGVPYINHPKYVASLVDTPVEKSIALLHDVLEDTFITKEDLIPVFGRRIVEILDILTRRKGEDYFDYIARVKQNPIATKIKLADLTHNSLPERNISDSLLKRYKKAKEILLHD